MAKYGAFFSVSENGVIDTIVSIYTFLDENMWFDGEVFICDFSNSFSENEKKYMFSLYNKTVFLSTENEVDYIIKNNNYKFILNINFNVIFLKDVLEDIEDFMYIFDVKSFKNEISISASIVDEENVEGKKIIFYDGKNITQYAENLKNKCIEDINNGGPYYKFSTELGETLLPKNLNDREKFIVCTCAKNENDYIIEWIEHYLKIGFDKILICDNNELGNNSLYETVESYISKGLVEILDCRHLDSFQVQFYSTFCTEGNYKWCGYFDCDEFLEIPSFLDIKHYLSTKENEYCVSFHWIVYGSNNEIFQTEGLLKDRFKYPVSPISIFTENCFIKSIVKGSGVFNKGCWFNGSHIPMTTPMYTHNIGGHFWTNSDRHCYFPPRYKDGYIRHYYTKSFNEWVKKRDRGWPDGTNKLTLGNYFICTNWAELPLERMTRGLFTQYGDLDSTRKYYRELLDGFNVIFIRNDDQNIYGLLLGMFNVMQSVTDCVFILNEHHIEDTVFNIILEYGIRTGNKVVWAETEEEKWNVIYKYSKDNNSYYELYLG